MRTEFQVQFCPKTMTISKQNKPETESEDVDYDLTYTFGT